MSQPRRIDLQSVDAAGTTVAYVRVGSGEPVVLLHGNLASHRYWQELLAAPPDGLELIAPDLPNFGASGRLAGEITVRAYGEAMAAFLAGLELDRLTLVGHSFGGAVAEACAGLAGRRIDRLLLVDAPPPSDYHAPETSLRWHELLAAEPSADARRAMIAVALPAVMPTRTPPYFEELVDEAVRIPPDAIVPNAYALEAMDLRALAARYTGPVLVLRGGKDLIVDEAMARDTVAAYGAPRARAVSWDDIGHSPQIEAPDRFAHLLSAFARGSEPGGAAMT